MCWSCRERHLEILQWLRAEGCPGDAMTCFEAITGGHVETLRWARENGCPWNAATPGPGGRGAWVRARYALAADLGNLA